MANLLNVERVSVGYGTRTLLDGVSLGVDEGDAIGVVGRNGDGKSTLLKILTATRPPDSGRVTHTSALSVGYLHQSDDFHPDATVRDVIGADPGEPRVRCAMMSSDRGIGASYERGRSSWIFRHSSNRWSG